ncbi:MAG TPA: NAD(P)H-hydrate dehydratase [Candidatus Acidoferrales bacterium]|nr:NAD(P)H-hydrate dehydratase [Candidatus Acidoferrales bacterium]
MKALTATEMNDVDRLTTERYGVASLALMENAGSKIVEFLRERFPNLARRRIVVLCGKGNNGGDGFVVARHLAEMGVKPVVYLFADPREMRGDAAVNRRRWQDGGGEMHVVKDASDLVAAKQAIAASDIVVDALLGTGVRGPVEGMLREAIEALNRRRRSQIVVAVDIPSGVLADTGELPGPAVEANCTITLTAPKIGTLYGQANGCCGELLVRDIGSPPEAIEDVGKGNVRWIEPRELAAFAMPRRPQGNKGDYGHALIVAGSAGKSGAAVLASWAALRAGAGLVTVATPGSVLPIVAAHTPEVMTEPLAATKDGSVSMGSIEGGYFDTLRKGKRALGIGPGLTTHQETSEFVRAVVREREVPIILDADGLNAFAGRAAELKNPKGRLAVTPHPGEMARLVGGSAGDVQVRRIKTAERCAAEWNCHVILKGHQTIIAAPDGRTWVNSTGNPGMATGGTGDVLTGILTGLTAQYGVESWGAMLSFGVYLHGLAGDLASAETGNAPLMAGDLIQFLPRAYRHFYSELDRG